MEQRNKQVEEIINNNIFNILIGDTDKAFADLHIYM